MVGEGKPADMATYSVCVNATVLGCTFTGPVGMHVMTTVSDSAGLADRWKEMVALLPSVRLPVTGSRTAGPGYRRHNGVPENSDGGHDSQDSRRKISGRVHAELVWVWVWLGRCVSNVRR